MDDILQALVKYFKGDRIESYETIDDMIELFLHEPAKISNKFREIIQEDAQDHSLCPICYQNLVTRESKNETVEYQGTPVNEPIHKRYCEYCGWEEQ